MAMITLRPGLTLEAGAAASWARMEKRRGRPLDVNRSLASRAVQQKLYEDYLRYLAGGPWAPLALPPDKSWHVLGLAVDTDDDEWIRAHPDHGWRFVVASEKWHAQYYPNLDRHRSEGMPADESAKPFPTIGEEDTMFRARSSKTGHWYIIGETTVTLIRAGGSGTPNHQHAAAYSKAVGKSFPSLTPAQITSLLKDAEARAAKQSKALAAAIHDLLADEE